MATDWRDVPDTPAWAGELLQELGDEATTIDVVHKRAEVAFVAEILQEQPPDVWQDWAQSNLSPNWLRSCVVEYSVASSRWQQVRQIAELELMDEVLGSMLHDDDEGEAATS